MLPIIANSSIIDKSAKTVSKQEEVIGGMDNYKKY